MQTIYTYLHTRREKKQKTKYTHRMTAKSGLQLPWVTSVLTAGLSAVSAAAGRPGHSVALLQALSLHHEPRLHLLLPSAVGPLPLVRACTPVGRAAPSFLCLSQTPASLSEHRKTAQGLASPGTLWLPSPCACMGLACSHPGLPQTDVHRARILTCWLVLFPDSSDLCHNNPHYIKS